VSDPTVIYSDNLSSIQFPKNLVFHARTKHIEVHYHIVRERVLSGEVELQYVPTDRQMADIFTKPLGLDKLRQFSGALGLRHLDVSSLRGRHDQEGRKEQGSQEPKARDVERRKEAERMRQSLNRRKPTTMKVDRMALTTRKEEVVWRAPVNEGVIQTR
jgi:hypothetical protein